MRIKIYGVFKGSLGFLTRTQKILAAANNYNLTYFWAFNCADQWLSNRSLYLYYFLISEYMSKAILGISAYYHDSAAALLIDGEIIAAAHEERFTRKKHDASFPSNACKYVLQEAGLSYQDLSAIAFYDKP